MSPSSSALAGQLSLHEGNSTGAGGAAIATAAAALAAASAGPNVGSFGALGAGTPVSYSPQLSPQLSSQLYQSAEVRAGRVVRAVMTEGLVCSARVRRAAERSQEEEEKEEEKAGCFVILHTSGAARLRRPTLGRASWAGTRPCMLEWRRPHCSGTGVA